MPTLVNLTFDIADLIGADFDVRRTKVWIETNIPSGSVIDTTGKVVRLGDVKATVGTDGKGTFTGLFATNSTDLNPTGFLYQVYVDYATRADGRKLWSSGWFPLTASSDLALVSPVVGGPVNSTDDAVIASRIDDPASQTRAAADKVYDRVTAVNPGDNLAAVLTAAVAGDKIIVRPGAHTATTLTLAVKADLVIKHGATITQTAAATGALLTITGAGATVRGRGTLDGNKANQSGTRIAGVYINADDVTVRDLVVQNTWGTGIYNAGRNGVTIRGNTVKDTAYLGIFAEPSGSAFRKLRVIDNHVDRSAEAPATIVEGGLKVRGSSTLDMTDVRVEGNTVLMPTAPTASAALCVEVWYAPGAKVCGNETSGGTMGVSVVHCLRPVISDNTVFTARDYGIEVGGCRRASVTGNTVDTVTNGVGIGLTAGGVNYSDHSTISGNTISGCGTAIKSQGATRVTVTGNALRGGTGYMLNLIAGDYSTVTGNNFDGLATATKAIVLDTSPGVTISGNTIISTTQHGVLLYAASAFTFYEVTISGNTMAGVGTPLATALSGGAALGVRIRAIGNAWAFAGMTSVDWLDYQKDLRDMSGTGTPEAAVIAGVGSRFLRTDGGAATTLYVKESGTGNTGWVAK